MDQVRTKIEYIHFKYTYMGLTKRFAIPRDEQRKVAALVQRVDAITPVHGLCWRDENSLICLSTEDDMTAAIDFAECQPQRPICVIIEQPPLKEQKVAEKRDELETPYQHVASSGFAAAAAAAKERTVIKMSEERMRKHLYAKDKRDLEAKKLQETAQGTAEVSAPPAADSIPAAPAAAVATVPAISSWPSDEWMSYTESTPATGKFLKDREEFLSKSYEIEKSSAHLEYKLLKEMHTHISRDELPKELELFYCLVGNNIRMHVYQEKKETLFTENKDVENEMIRLLATDVAKRLLKMRTIVGRAIPEIRKKMIWKRVCELEKHVEEGRKTTDWRRIGCEHNIRPILCNSQYRISYNPNENGFASAYDGAREFTVLLDMKAKERLAEAGQAVDSPIINEEQRRLLKQLVDMDLFDLLQYYDKMVEVCCKAANLEEAIELMIEE